jgi:mRNA-degrading endonuclease RelE of RelBE toxin-antitoxin system
MGRKIPEFKHSPYKELLLGSYRIIYKLNKEKAIIYIMAVIHSHRLLKINLIKQTK